MTTDRFARRRCAAVSAVAVGALLAGCDGSDRQPPAAPLVPPELAVGPVVVMVDGQPLPDSMLQAYLRMRGQLAADRAARDAAGLELADLLLLAERARDDGLLERASVRAELAVQRLSWIANRALADHAERHPVSDADIEAEYAVQVERTGRREFRLQHLLAPSREVAEALIARLEAGEAFATLREEQVERFGMTAAGSIDWVNLTQVPPAFGPAVSELANGEFTTTPVQSEYGWHVILLEATRPFTPPALEAVREGIRATLARRKAEAYLAELRTAATVELPSR